MISRSSARAIGTEKNFTGSYAARGRVKLTEHFSYWGFTARPDIPEMSIYQAMIKRAVGADNFYLHVGNGTNQAYTESSTPKDAAWHILEIQRLPDACKGIIDDSDSWNENTYAANDAKELCVSARGNTTGTQVDWMLVRKYVDPEPQIDSVGPARYIGP